MEGRLPALWRASLIGPTFESPSNWPRRLSSCHPLKQYITKKGYCKMLITINIDDTPVRDLFARLRSRTQDLSPVMRNIGEIIIRSVEKNFASEGRPRTWDKSKRGGQTLSDTGRLRHSFTVKAYSDHAEVGTNVTYAAFHQFGTRPYVIVPKGKKALFWKGAKHPVKKVNHPGLPPRPFLMVQDEDWGTIHRAILKYITDV